MPAGVSQPGSEKAGGKRTIKLVATKIKGAQMVRLVFKLISSPEFFKLTLTLTVDSKKMHAYKYDHAVGFYMCSYPTFNRGGKPTDVHTSTQNGRDIGSYKMVSGKGSC